MALEVRISLCRPKVEYEDVTRREIKRSGLVAPLRWRMLRPNLAEPARARKR